MNLRIARSCTVLLPPQMTHILSHSFGGMAVIGPPLSGKTTVLRGIAQYLGRIGRSCCVIDERDELYVSNQNNQAFDGIDIIAGMSKADGALTALRTLSPQVILLDELGEMQEVGALRQAMFSGVDFIVTLHAESFAEAERKPQYRALRSIDALRCVCILAGRREPGVIAEMRCL